MPDIGKTSTKHRSRKSGGVSDWLDTGDHSLLGDDFQVAPDSNWSSSPLGLYSAAKFDTYGEALVPLTKAPAAASQSTYTASSPAAQTLSAPVQTAAAAAATPSWVSSIRDAGIKADMTSASADGVVTEAEMSRLFQNLSTKLTTTGARLTSSQFTDLKTVANNINVGETASEYVTYITRALVNGNASNTNWTGGGSYSVYLGNLAAGDTGSKLTKLTGKWFMGTDLPANTIYYANGTPTSYITYSTVNKALFTNGTPSMNDVNQGYAGDCYLMASLAEVAYKNPNIIKSMITDNGNGTYGVRFIVDGQARWVTVNASLANGGTLLNDGTAMWASLIEKAYAQVQAGGCITGRDIYYNGNSFTTIANGGMQEAALAQITGASQIVDFQAHGSTWDESVYDNGLRNTLYSTSGLSTQTVLNYIKAALDAGDDVILGSKYDAYDSNGNLTLVAGHSMSVYGYNSATGMLKIRNPYGSNANASPGKTWLTTFEVSLDTLLAAGDAITIDNAASKKNYATGAAVAAASTSDFVITGGELASTVDLLGMDSGSNLTGSAAASGIDYIEQAGDLIHSYAVTDTNASKGIGFGTNDNTYATANGTPSLAGNATVFYKNNLETHLAA